jgi:hypothetical protein
LPFHRAENSGLPSCPPPLACDKLTVICGIFSPSRQFLRDLLIEDFLHGQGHDDFVAAIEEGFNLLQRSELKSDDMKDPVRTDNRAILA